MTFSTSMLTRVVKTIGFLPSTSAVWLIWRTAWWALSTLSMNGRRTWRGFISNWARMALPKVSAVMPVPSEMKNTVRVCMGALSCNAFRFLQAREREPQAYNPGNYPIPLHAPPPPTTNKSKAGRRAMGKRCRTTRRHPERFNFRSFPMSALFSPTALVVPFENLRMTDVEAVGGKNASLGEMISQLPQGVRVPTGFATTAHAFRQFLAHDGLADKINARLASLDTEDVRALAAAGAEIRAMVEAQPFPGSGKSHPRRLCHAECGQPRRHLCGALVRHGRRPAGRVVCRPAGNLPERGRASTTCCTR
jgi:hypothetical protein